MVQSKQIDIVDILVTQKRSRHALLDQRSLYTVDYSRTVVLLYHTLRELESLFIPPYVLLAVRTPQSKQPTESNENDNEMIVNNNDVFWTRPSFFNTRVHIRRVHQSMEQNVSNVD